MNGHYTVEPGRIEDHNLDLQLETLLDHARRHGQDSEDIEYEVGDLQGLIWAAWRQMGHAQRRALLGSEGAQAIRDIMQDPDESDEEPAALRVDA